MNARSPRARTWVRVDAKCVALVAASPHVPDCGRICTKSEALRRFPATVKAHTVFFTQRYASLVDAPMMSKYRLSEESLCQRPPSLISSKEIPSA